MSNKHWCMPNYPFINAIRARPEWKRKLKGLDNLAALDVVQKSSKEYTAAHDAKDFFTRACAIESFLLIKNTPCLFIQTESLAQFMFETSYPESMKHEILRKDFTSWFCFPRMVIGGINTGPCAMVFLSNSLTCFYGRYGENFIANNVNLDGVIHSNPNTDLYINVMTKLSVGAMIYAEAFPDCVKDGLPENVNPFSATTSKILTTHPKLIHTAQRGCVSPHLRAGHWRYLHDSRFRHEEDGSPRIIFVRSTVVAGRLTAKTAVGL